MPEVRATKGGRLFLFLTNKGSALIITKKIGRHIQGGALAARVTNLQSINLTTDSFLILKIKFTKY